MVGLVYLAVTHSHCYKVTLQLHMVVRSEDYGCNVGCSCLSNAIILHYSNVCGETFGANMLCWCALGRYDGIGLMKLASLNSLLLCWHSNQVVYAVICTH